MSYSEAFMRAHAVMKLSESEHEVVVGCVAPVSATLARLRRFHRKPVRTVAVELRDVAAALGVTESALRPPVAVQNGGAHGLDTLLNAAPVEDLVNSVLTHAVAARASDIYVEVRDSETSIRHRIDGVVQHDCRLRAELGRALAAKLKAMAGMDSLNIGRPQDGRMSIRAFGATSDVRVSSIPVRGGESLALRLLAERKSVLSVRDLGFSPDLERKIARLHLLPSGLVIACGPGDSGKSTTLHAVLSNAISAGRRVITVEDPVEYAIAGAAQVSCRRDGSSQIEILKSVLRQSPDVVLVGEIRDAQTLGLAIRAALTGHLIFATLHAASPRQALHRLAELGAAEALLSESVKAVISQRLLRRLCPTCRGSGRTAAPPREGCRHCRGSGYRGRVAVGELVWCADAADAAYAEAGERLRADAERAVGRAVTDRAELSRVIGVAHRRCLSGAE